MNMNTLLIHSICMEFLAALEGFCNFKLERRVLLGLLISLNLQRLIQKNRHLCPQRTNMGKQTESPNTAYTAPSKAYLCLRKEHHQDLFSADLGQSCPSRCSGSGGHVLPGGRKRVEVAQNRGCGTPALCMS